MNNMEEKIIQEDLKIPKKQSVMQQKLKFLEQDWQTLTKSKPKLRKCNSIDNSSSITLKKHLMLVETTPRELMSSLQQPTVALSSPVSVKVSGEVWRVRENELAREEEARKERRTAAFEKGELIGRRLFEGEEELGFDLVGSSASVCIEEGETEEMLCFGETKDWGEEVVKQVSEKKGYKKKRWSKGVSQKGREYGRSLMLVFKLCIVFTFMVVVLFVFADFDEFRSGNQEIVLVPT